ncbi:hypothetical protein [Paenibacillus sp. YIM B09110]
MRRNRALEEGRRTSYAQPSISGGKLACRLHRGMSGVSGGAGVP